MILAAVTFMSDPLRKSKSGCSCPTQTFSTLKKPLVDLPKPPELGLSGWSVSVCSKVCPKANLIHVGAFALTQNFVLKGVCGVHVDDLLGGGEKDMGDALLDLKKRLPFGDYRTHTLRNTGREIIQNRCRPGILHRCFAASWQVDAKPLGSAQTPLSWADHLENMRWTAGLGL